MDKFNELKAARTAGESTAQALENSLQRFDASIKGVSDKDPRRFAP